MPSSSSSPSSSAFSSASKQASKLLEGGWPACWLLCDQDLKIGAEDRTLIERAFAHAGGRNVQPETVRKVVEQFGRDAGFARKAVAGLLERSADEPVRNFGMYLEGAVSDEIWARNEARQVEADQAAKRELADALKIRPPSPVEVGRIHAYLWQSGDRPEKWEACPCAACEQGRAVPA